MFLPFVMHSSKCYNKQETFILFTSAEPNSKNYQMFVALLHMLKMLMLCSFSAYTCHFIFALLAALMMCTDEDGHHIARITMFEVKNSLSQ